METKATPDIGKWVDQYSEEMYSWAYHKTSDPEVARDLTQDTFLAALQGISNFKGNSTPKTWLFSILNNKIVDYYRRKIKSPVFNESKGDNDIMSRVFDNEQHWRKESIGSDWHTEDTNLLDNPEFNKVLNFCIGQLPEKWRLSVQYKYYSDKDGAEICQELEITPSNYWQILHRAKLQLRECIENNWFKN